MFPTSKTAYFNNMTNFVWPSFPLHITNDFNVSVKKDTCHVKAGQRFNWYILVNFKLFA